LYTSVERASQPSREKRGAIVSGVRDLKVRDGKLRV
jgi:hypothetical protein